MDQLEKNWDNHDVFVIDAPVAAGKSLIALTISNFSWKKYGAKAAILTPNNLLVRQYTDEFPWIPTVQRQDKYTCTRYESQSQKRSCKKVKGEQSYFCKGCPYVTDLRKVQAFPVGVTNYHSYVAYKNYRPTVIFDEAHNLIGTIGGMAARKIWHHEYHYPSWVKDYRTLYRWVCEELERPERTGSITKLVALKMELESNKVKFIFTRGEARWHKEDRDCILASPVDISEEPPIFWPPKVKKIFLLSATINSRDIKALGLSNRKVYYVNSPSMIPKEQRPCIVEPSLNMSYAHQEKNLPLLAEKLHRLLETNPAKGVIHAPYALARKLQSILDHPRLIYHSTLDKMDRFREFQQSPGTVLVASGLYEGISLDEDLARWQVITKVPWPSLAEPAMEYQAKEDSEYYANATIKDIVQTYGRVCRGPKDYGETFIYDSSFVRLFKQYFYLFPLWFRESVTIR